MSKATTKASWVGKAAHQIGADTGCGGSTAYLEAARLAADLTAYGIDLDQVDPPITSAETTTRAHRRT